MLFNKILFLLTICISLYSDAKVYEFSSLGVAIIKNDTQKAKELINDGVKLRVYENEDSIKKIITPNVYTTYVGGIDIHAYPIVILAAVNGMDEIIKLMYKKDKQSIYLKDKDGNDALMWATREGRVSTVKLLLEYGFDPLYESEKYKDNAYELAIRKSRYKIISLYIDILYSRAEMKKLSYTIWRVARHNTKLIEKLLKLGVKDTYKGIAPRTSLMKAAEVGKLDTVKLLIKYGSDPYEANISSTRYGYDPLTLAIYNGQDNVVKYLLENYTYNLKKVFNGNNYLHMAVNEYIKLDTEIFLLLIKKSNLDINSLNKYGESLLDKVVQGQSLVIASENLKDIKFLLQLDLNENVLKNSLKTAEIYIKRYKGNKEKSKHAQDVYRLIKSY